uniref:guanylate cyclase n=1 Tax=Elaeophora elaphi TaxID=1147741 RepID=A0A0R3RX79_9BILA
MMACYYDDEITINVARAVSHALNLSLNATWEVFGVYFVHFVMKTGWDELLQALAYDLKGFLNSLDQVHYFADNIAFSMKLRGPMFRCEFNDDGSSLLLHYYSSRTGFPGFIKGAIREVSRRIFGIEIEMTIESRFREHLNSVIKEHIVFSITGEKCGLSLNEFAIIFPYHICFTCEFRILHCVTLLSNGHFIYMGSLNVSDVVHLSERGLFISDIQLHDATRNIVMVNQLTFSQIAQTFLEEEKNNLKKLTKEVAIAKDKSENLLYELLPPFVAEILRMGQTVQACEYTDATLLFSDIVTFTKICAACVPYDVFNMLNDLYTKFDRIAKINDVYKVETIGDAYVVASGVPTQCIDHSERILNMAIGMQMEVKSVKRPGTDIPLEIRVGVHTGPVFAGVVGIKMPRYCLFGKTVSMARELESNGVPRRICVSETTKNSALQTNNLLEFIDGGVVEIKGVGQTHIYFLERNGRKTVWDICAHIKGQSADGYFELYEVKNSPPKKETPYKVSFKKYVHYG